MKKQDLNKYQAMSVADLNIEIQKKSVELTETRLKQALMQDKNVKKAKILKNDISILKTIIRNNQLINSTK